MSDLPVFFKGEVQLAGWGETHNGGCKLAFWLPDSEALEPFRGATSRKGKIAGQRFMCVLVEIDDDESPKMQPKYFSSEAHLMVTGPYFVAYCRANVHTAASWDADRCKRYAKWLCGLESLSELDSDPAKAKKFRALIQQPLAEWSETHDPTREREPGEDDEAGDDS